MMYAWEAIQNTVDIIEEDLKKEWETEELANMVSLSPFYFQRLFRRLVHKPVQEYIKLRRMSCVLTELTNTNKRILEIALEYGYSNHANFTRAFKEVYGITPEGYKKERPLLNTFHKPEIAMNYVMMDENVPLIIGNIVLEIKRKQILTPECYVGLTAKVNIATQTPVGQSTGIDEPGQLWKRFHQEKTSIANILDPTVTLGMSYLPDPQNNVFTYFAGGHCLSTENKAINHFVMQELAAGEYMVCSIEAESFEKLVTEALDTANSYLFGTWLPNHNITTEPFSAEKYYNPTDGISRMEIWVKPIL